MRYEQTNIRTVKIELLSQWQLEAEFRNFCGQTKVFLGCSRHNCPRSIKHEVFTFWKNGLNSRPAETDPYMKRQMREIDTFCAPARGGCYWRSPSSVLEVSPSPFQSVSTLLLPRRHIRLKTEQIRFFAFPSQPYPCLQIYYCISTDHSKWHSQTSHRNQPSHSTRCISHTSTFKAPQVSACWS